MVVFAAKTFQSLGQRTGSKIGAATHHQPGGLAPGVGIDDPDSTAFLTCHILSFGFCGSSSCMPEEPPRKNGPASEFKVGTCRILWIQYAIVKLNPSLPCPKN